MAISLDTSIQYLTGVGPKRAALYQKLDIHTVRDLLYYFPRSYIDLTAPCDIAAMPLFEQCAVRARVVANYCRSKEQIEQFSAQMEREGCAVIPVQADVSDPEQVERMVQTVQRQFGHIDVLVCNAGIARQGLLTDFSPADWRQMMSVNLDGTFYCCRSVLPGMIRRQSGCIITTSSIWGITGASCEVPYSAAKAGIIGLTRALAKEVGPSGIRVNCIAPGVIDTEMNGNLTPEVMAQLREETPLGTIGTPKQVADLALYLVGEGASFLTGQVISPNGGFLI